MNEYFPISEADLEILQTKPPTAESLGRAALLGVELGQTWVMQPEQFTSNLRLTVLETLKKQLPNCPWTTVEAFTSATFKTRTYLESRKEVLMHLGADTLDKLDQDYRATV